MRTGLIRLTNARAFVFALAAFAAPGVWAQQAPPPAPKRVAEVPLLTPPSARPPSTVAPSPRVTAERRTPTPAAVIAMPPVSALPPDSVRPAAASASVVRPIVRTPPPALSPAGSAARSSAAVRAVAVAPPTGATMQCKDGTFLTGRPLADRCDGNGGVAVIFPSAPQPPPPPLRRP